MVDQADLSECWLPYAHRANSIRDTLAAKRDQPLGPKIGKWGHLQEWMLRRDDPKDTHRHLSHLRVNGEVKTVKAERL
jgi:hypothetical protein